MPALSSEQIDVHLLAAALSCWNRNEEAKVICSFELARLGYRNSDTRAADSFALRMAGGTPRWRSHSEARMLVGRRLDCDRIRSANLERSGKRVVNSRGCRRKSGYQNTAIG